MSRYLSDQDLLTLRAKTLCELAYAGCTCRASLVVRGPRGAEVPACQVCAQTLEDQS